MTKTKTERLSSIIKEANGWLDDTDPDVVIVIEEGEWTQDHKTQACTHIVEFEGDFFSITQYRSGSYHTDWFYEDPIVTPVNRVETTKVVVSWEPCGQGVS